MISITHLVVSLLLIQLMNLDRNDAFVALVFGVFIDIDHLFGLREYAETRGFAALFDIDSLMNPGGQWKSLFHSPMAVGMVAPMSVGSRLAVPLLFWGVHLTMDFAEDNILGLLSAPEAVLAVIAACGFVSLRYAKYLEAGSASTLMEYFRREVRSFRNMMRPSVC
jgi:hypothetical protein